MEINLIREKLTDKLCSNEVYDSWIDLLQETNPGNYGVEDVEVNIDYNDIWVIIPERTFTFKNTELLFNARLGGSSGESGYDAKFKKIIAGNGKFVFENKSQDIKIIEITINEPLDLY